MPLQLIEGDITTIHCDAIVNAANETLLGGGGVDGAIHRVAGAELLAECRTLGGCKTGEAKLTGGYALPCKYVIHTVGPIWQGGNMGEEKLLTACYANSLALAAERGCESVAFPLISSGAYGYPAMAAKRVAKQVITDFLQTHEMLVYLVFYDKKGQQAQYPELERMLLWKAAAAAQMNAAEKKPRRGLLHSLHNSVCRDEIKDASAEQYAVQEEAAPSCAEAAFAPAASLTDALNGIDESFTEMLLRKIDERGMTDAECYKKANIDRKLFSKIRSDVHYRPKKVTAIAFALALELDYAETEELLRKAGYALSNSSKFDIIVTYYIQKGVYNVFEINEALFAFDQLLIGA